MKTITRKTYAKRIERVLHYIVDHLDDVGESPLDIHRLAEEAFLSPYHFHRVYVAMMGETVADTLRRHRLHRAAIQLNASATPVALLASEAGYGSAQAFTNEYGRRTDDSEPSGILGDVCPVQFYRNHSESPDMPSD